MSCSRVLSLILSAGRKLNRFGQVLIQGRSIGSLLLFVALPCLPAKHDGNGSCNTDHQCLAIFFPPVLECLHLFFFGTQFCHYPPLLNSIDCYTSALENLFQPFRQLLRAKIIYCLILIPKRCLQLRGLIAFEQGYGRRTRLTRLGSDILQPCTMSANTQSRQRDRKSTRLNSSHVRISYAVFCLKKK